MKLARFSPGSEIRGQVLRYFISGVLLTLLYSTIYWTLAGPLNTQPLLANTIGFLAALVGGWVVHSRWTFGRQGDRSKPGAVYLRFLIVNLAGYALNTLWVWLIVTWLQGDVVLPIVPIAVVTPAVMFLANRFWTFG